MRARRVRAAADARCCATRCCSKRRPHEPPSRGRRKAEQGPHLWGCDRGAGQGASPAGPRASAGSHPKGNPVPPFDAPALARGCEQGECAQPPTHDAVRPARRGGRMSSRAGAGATRSRGRARRVDRSPRASAGCGRSRRAQAWGGVAAWRPEQTKSHAAFSAPARASAIRSPQARLQEREACPARRCGMRSLCPDSAPSLRHVGSRATLRETESGGRWNAEQGHGFHAATRIPSKLGPLFRPPTRPRRRPHEPPR